MATLKLFFSSTEGAADVVFYILITLEVAELEVVFDDGLVGIHCELVEYIFLPHEDREGIDSCIII